MLRFVPTSGFKPVKDPPGWGLWAERKMECPGMSWAVCFAAWAVIYVVNQEQQRSIQCTNHFLHVQIHVGLDMSGSTLVFTKLDASRCWTWPTRRKNHPQVVDASLPSASVCHTTRCWCAGKVSKNSGVMRPAEFHRNAVIVSEDGWYETSDVWPFLDGKWWWTNSPRNAQTPIVDFAWGH